MTFAERLPGLQVEAVLNPDAPGHLALCIKHSKNIIEVRPFLDHDGVIYFPGRVPRGLGQLVRFPGIPSDSGSTEKLQSEMKNLFSKHLDQETQTINVLVAFAFASWFVECFEVAPILWLHGPDAEVCIALRLLNIICYHPVLVGDLDVSALRTLPAGLRVTLLIKEPDLAPGVERALLNSVRHHFYFAKGSQPIDMFGARALHCNSASHDIGLNCSIDPARHHLPCLSESDEDEASRFFQAGLLAYRMNHNGDTQKFDLESSESSPGFEQELRAWVSALPRGSDVKNSVISAFAERRADSLSARFEDPTCLVAEATLSFCHMNSVKFFYVGELAEKVNDLLLGRHSDGNFEDRKIGSVLKTLGIHANRVTKGYRVDLTREMRQRIHAVARAYRVLSTQPTVIRCADCKREQ